MKLEAISLIKENLFTLRADLTVVSQLKDRLILKQILELVKEQITLAKEQGKTARSTLTVAQISLLISLFFGLITILSFALR